MKHSEKIESYQGSLKDLANEIGNLRYDKLLEFLCYLSDNIYLQAQNDLFNKRVKLATCLFMAEKNIKAAAMHVEDAWRISKPYMKSFIKD